VLYEVSPSESVTAAAVTGDMVYWAVSRTAVLLDTARVLRREVDADQPEQLMLTAGYDVTELAAVAEDVYWVEEDSDWDMVTQADTYRVWRLPAPGVEPELLWVDDREITELAADASGAYWNAGDAILGLRAGQDEVELLADNQEVDGLVLSERALLWHDSPGKLMALVK
jgi:hypothetical protein